ncbi:MAG: LAGLIDADG family homing endonuclease [Candidatus Hodarchaeales archaeon]|jgi:hypothetical protein
MKRHGIARRKISEAQYARWNDRLENDQNLFKTLNNPDELRKLYWNEENPLSAMEIARKLDCSKGMVINALKKHKIKARTLVESAQLRFNKNIPLTKSLIEFINGSLLGDGSIIAYKRVSNFSLGTKHREYANHVQSLFQKAGYKTRINKCYHKKFDCTSYQFATYSSFQLQEYRERWYPGGKKQIPKDLTLTPSSCLYWYLEDGSLKTYNKKVNAVRLYTNAFTQKENKKLIRGLITALLIKEGIKLTKDNYIRMSAPVSRKFLEFVGMRSPVKCFNYKFDPSLKATRY